MSRFTSLAALGLLAGLSLCLSAGTACADDAWGTVKGQVVIDGDVPAPKVINVTQDPAHCLSKGKLYEEQWVVNPKNKGVRYVLVWLAPENGAAKLPIHPKLKDVPTAAVVVDQPCCQFVPHVTALREGQVLVVKNSAPVPHNVNWKSRKNPGNNLIVPPGGKIEIKDLVADLPPVDMACNIHGWMRAKVGVFDHPYFAVTDEDGKFEIPNAPAGKYRIGMYLEGNGWGPGGKKGQPITIKADGDTDLGKVGVKPE